VDVNGCADSHGDNYIDEVLASFRVSEFLFRECHGAYAVFKHDGQTKLLLDVLLDRNIGPTGNLRPKKQHSRVAVDHPGHRYSNSLYLWIALNSSAEFALDQIEDPI